MHGAARGNDVVCGSNTKDVDSAPSVCVAVEVIEHTAGGEGAETAGGTLGSWRLGVPEGVVCSGVCCTDAHFEQGTFSFCCKSHAAFLASAASSCAATVSFLAVLASSFAASASASSFLFCSLKASTRLSLSTCLPLSFDMLVLFSRV